MSDKDTKLSSLHTFAITHGKTTVSTSGWKAWLFEAGMFSLGVLGLVFVTKIAIDSDIPSKFRG